MTWFDITIVATIVLVIVTGFKSHHSEKNLIKKWRNQNGIVDA